MPFPELHGESTEYVGRAEDAIIATSNYRLHIKFKESVVNVSIFEKRPMTLEVWCDERTFPTQLKVTKEWILMSLLESVWRCVVMFCEWAELGGGGPLCQRCGDRAIQSRSALASSATWLLITSVFDTRLPAPSALSLHLPLPWLQWFQRGRRTVAPSLSLRLLSPR